MTQAALAQRVHRKHCTVFRWLTGETIPRLPVITVVADALGVTVHELLGIEEIHVKVSRQARLARIRVWINLGCLSPMTGRKSQAAVEIYSNIIPRAFLPPYQESVKGV